MDICVNEDSESSKLSTVRKRRPTSKSEKAKFSKQKKERKTKESSVNGGKPTSSSANSEEPLHKSHRECGSIQILSKKHLEEQPTISSRPSWSQEKQEKSFSFEDKNKRSLSKLEKSWLSLLEQRPPNNDTPALCAWLDEVLSNSEDFEDIMKKPI